MQKAPTYQERFDRYEPQKYNCIVVDDDLIEPILVDLCSVDCYWHTLQKPGEGLAYCGITLIPLKSTDAFIKVLYAQSKQEYNPLLSLASQAKKEGKYIIHFGI